MLEKTNFNFPPWVCLLACLFVYVIEKYTKHECHPVAYKKKTIEEIFKCLSF